MEDHYMESIYYGLVEKTKMESLARAEALSWAARKGTRIEYWAVMY